MTGQGEQKGGLHALATLSPCLTSPLALPLQTGTSMQSGTRGSICTDDLFCSKAKGSPPIGDPPSPMVFKEVGVTVQTEIEMPAWEVKEASRSIHLQRTRACSTWPRATRGAWRVPQDAEF